MTPNNNPDTPLTNEGVVHARYLSATLMTVPLTIVKKKSNNTVDCMCREKIITYDFA
jgi:hypothetical protein